MSDETTDQNDTNETKDNETAESDALTGEPFDEVAGSNEPGHGREVLFPKPYPPWPGSS